MSGMTVYGPVAAAGPPPQRGREARSQPTDAAEGRRAELDQWSAAVKEEQPKSLVEMMAEAKERAEARREAFKRKPSTRYGDAPMEAYARLAKARNQADVNAAAGYARRRIAQFKLALRQDGDNADRIRAAIAQLQKAVVRAGRKKKDLSREAVAEHRRERALEEARRREAQRMRLELQRAKAQRAIRERGYLQEAAISDRMAVQMAMARAQYQLPTQTAAVPGQTSPAGAAGGYTASVAAAAPAPAAGGEAFCVQA